MWAGTHRHPSQVSACLTVQTRHGIGPAQLQSSSVTTATQTRSSQNRRTIMETKHWSGSAGNFSLAQGQKTGDEAHKSALGLRRCRMERAQLSKVKGRDRLTEGRVSTAPRRGAGFPSCSCRFFLLLYGLLGPCHWMVSCPGVREQVLTRKPQYSDTV